MKHRRTDPACRLHRMPRTRWGRDRARGKGCTACVLERGLEHALLKWPELGLSRLDLLDGVDPWARHKPSTLDLQLDLALAKLRAEQLDPTAERCPHCDLIDTPSRHDCPALTL